MLTDYIIDTQALIRDANGLFTSTTQLTRWINHARKQIANRTGCLRVLVTGQSPFGSTSQPGIGVPGAIIPGMLPDNQPNGANASGAVATTSNSFQTIVGTEFYPYGFANPYVKAQAAGIKGIVNVMNVAVSWGGIRPALDWQPWEDLQAYARSYNLGVTSYPFLWSCTNESENGQVWLFPVPSQQMEFEWDCLCVPSDLYADTDYDAIPDGFKAAVKYYAAFLAYLGSQRFGQARVMHDLFEDQLGISRYATDNGKTPDWYSFTQGP